MPKPSHLFFLLGESIVLTSDDFPAFMKTIPQKSFSMFLLHKKPGRETTVIVACLVWVHLFTLAY